MSPISFFALALFNPSCINVFAERCDEISYLIMNDTVIKCKIEVPNNVLNSKPGKHDNFRKDLTPQQNNASPEWESTRCLEK